GLLAAVVVALYACDDAAAAPTAFPIINGESDNSTIASRAPVSLRIPLTPVGEDLYYIASADIGTNPRPFNLVMDTGTSDFWVYAEACPQRGRHNGVSPAASPQMLVDPASRWSILYNEQSRASGIMARDTIHFGGVSVPGYLFGMAGSASGIITQSIEDGLLGFAPQRGSRMGIPSMAQVLARNGVIPAPITGWFLSRRRDGGRGGELALGTPNEAKFKVETLTPPIPNIGGIYWSVPVTGAKINGVPIPAVGNIAAVLDSATTLILMPHHDATAINQQLRAIYDATTENFYIPCNTNLQVSFTIDNQDWAIDPRDLVATRRMRPDGYCQSNIQGASDLSNTWMLGATFMKNVYAVMNYDTDEIQLARIYCTVKEYLDEWKNGVMRELPKSSTGDATGSYSPETATMHPTASSPTHPASLSPPPLLRLALLLVPASALARLPPSLPQCTRIPSAHAHAHCHMHAHRWRPTPLSSLPNQHAEKTKDARDGTAAAA
ncbi:hypothetical protein EVG20_g11675, partial [Dentipellis fragilis]